jgi:hypothetical protein
MVQNYELCHCERSEAICWIDGNMFESNVQKELKVSFMNPTDCFTAFAMTAIYTFFNPYSPKILTAI